MPAKFSAEVVYITRIIIAGNSIVLFKSINKQVRVNLSGQLNNFESARQTSFGDRKIDSMIALLLKGSLLSISYLRIVFA